MARAMEKEKTAEKPKEEEERTPLVTVSEMLNQILGTKTNKATPEQKAIREAFADDVTETARAKYNVLDQENKPAVCIVMKFKDGYLYKSTNVCTRHATLLLLDAAHELVTDEWKEEKEEEKEQKDKPET